MQPLIVPYSKVKTISFAVFMLFWAVVMTWLTHAVFSEYSKTETELWIVLAAGTITIGAWIGGIIMLRISTQNAPFLEVNDKYIRVEFDRKLRQEIRWDQVTRITEQKTNKQRVIEVQTANTQKILNNKHKIRTMDPYKLEEYMERKNYYINTTLATMSHEELLAELQTRLSHYQK